MKRRKPDNETARQRFVRFAEARTNAVIDKLRVLGNLSNKRNYDYSEEEIDKIFSAINRQVREVRAKFDTHRSRKFKL